MKEINLEVLHDCANRLLFTMSDEEYATLLDEFSILTKQMRTIGEIPDLDKYEPMTFPFDVTTSYLREDVATEPLMTKEALKNAGSVMDNQIKLPKVVG